ncbi:DUF502 domain-containing protein [Solitalea sp. MAHUQ-68]|uniref:DUF502 domain-containing protein n=1 Tax=Solitalea agri TaxID=2953739 RepID=A0A9X2F3G5_9SPHI|nr:DUF502 domain-containing protein [Solitalea agri]MCO4291676.1 DUF502 domain-containing protein [Solitalea agri]
MDDIGKLRRKARARSVWKVLFGFFIKGLLFVLPLGLTFYIIASGIRFVDSLIVFGDLKIPGLGLAIVLVSITFVGVLVTYLITEPISNYFERLLNKIPVFKLIYSSIKDFMEAFFGDEKKFNEPVVVQINELGLKKVGFITQKDLSILGLEDEVGVYFPHSYNFSGEFFIVPSKYVKPLQLNSGEVMKFTVSGGVSDLK